MLGDVHARLPRPRHHRHRLPAATPDAPAADSLARDSARRPVPRRRHRCSRITSTPCGSRRSATPRCSGRRWASRARSSPPLPSATFAVLFGGFLAARAVAARPGRLRHFIMVNGRPLQLPVGPVLRFLAFAGSAVVALVTAGGHGVGLADVRALVVRPAVGGAARRRRSRRRSDLRPADRLLPVHAAGVGAHRRLADDDRGAAARGRGLLRRRVGRSRRDGRHGRSAAMARRRLCPARLALAWALVLLVALAAQVWLGRYERLLDDHTIFAGATYTDAHVTAHRQRDRRHCARCSARWSPSSPAMTRRSIVWLAGAAAAGRGAAYLVTGVVASYVSSFIVKPNELVRERPYIEHNIAFTRQAYGLDRIVARQFPAETTVEAADPAGNSADAAEHPAVGLARPAGHAAPAPGDPHLLRLSRHRHRSLHDRRRDAAGDAGDARAERRQAAREQPQLDQREADLHPRLRRDDELRERLHAGRAAAAAAEGHAGAVGGTGTDGDAARDLLRRDDRHRRLRQHAAAGVQLSAGSDQQRDVVSGHRGHRPRRRAPAAADRDGLAATSPSCRSATTSGRRAGC